MIVERVRSIDNMKDDEELEMLLGEIPHATSLTHHHHHLSHTSGNHHHHHYHHHVVNGNGHGFGSSVTPHSMNRSYGILMYGGVYDDDPSSSYKQSTCISPASVFSLQSNGSSSSLFSNGHSPLSDKGSPTPPPLDDSNPKAHMLIRNSHFPCENLPDSKLPNSSFGKKVGENLVDELNLSCNLSRMYISEEQEEVLVRDRRMVPNRFNYARIGASDDYSKPFSDYTVVQSPVPRSSVGFSGEISPALFGFQQNCGLLGMQISPGQAENLFSRSNFDSSLLNSQCHASRELAGYNCYKRDIPASNLVAPNVLYSTRQNGMNILEERGIGALPNLQNLPQLSQPRLNANIDYEHHQLPHISNGRAASATSNRTPHGGFLTLAAGEDSLIIQDEGVSHGRNKGFGGLRGQNRKCSLREKRSQLETTRSQLVGTCENGRSAKMHWSFSSPIRCNSLTEAQGYIFMIAKDQHGCRFLQKIFDEGSPQDVKIVFDEIIGHVVELMINPFGNYLMQKLLEVCNEEQRMHILMVVTNEPMELVRISLNTHGTRVVQKLIETLKTRQQVKLVISALEPGFLSLIKDLNGNHVIQRCLQCLSNEDNKFIFEAAAKYCVDIATHQHGCCVLQRCINHSTGEHRESLVAEISANGLHLAQDSFGNYVVQYILELQIPSAVSKLISQFEGNYVHLSRQKFSSHVVEKCLSVLDGQVRSMIIHELLSATHFEQLLQDPHANYVIQTALRVAEGPLHNSLVSVIESHKAISRNSPYSKRIFSHKLLKK